MSGRLKDKVAIITGGGSGFGLGIATKFIKEGAKVVISDVSAENGERTAETLGCTSCQANVTKREDWQAVLKHTLDTHGQLDIVVNNAGASYPNKSTTEVTDDEFDLCFNVNVKSLHLCCTELLPYFLDNQRPGSVIQISSTGALRPRPGLTWYNASKAAISIATRTMAIESGPKNIRFNCVNPGIASTAMTHLFLGKENTEENRAGFVSTVPLGRISAAEDIANACCYLASDEASFVTGIEHLVDGGRCA